MTFSASMTSGPAGRRVPWSDRPIVHVYSLCWNEELFLPYYLDHYGKIADRITVYDNHSTDRSVEIIESRPRTHVIPYDTGDQINDEIYLELKNNIWKQSRGVADWVIIVDIDEILYHAHLDRLLAQAREDRYHLLNPTAYHMVSRQYPTYDGRPITARVKKGFIQRDWGKQAIFDPIRIQEINYAPGAHQSDPVASSPIRIWHSADHRDSLKLLHYKYIGLDRLKQRHRQCEERLSQANYAKNMGLHYKKWPRLDELFVGYEQKARRVLGWRFGG